MLKILYDGQIFSIQKYGGISRYYCQLLESNCPNNIESTVFAPFSVNYYLPKLDETICSKKINHFPVFRGSHRIYRGLSRLSLSLNLCINDYDVIHETYYYNSFYGGFNGKIVTTVHDMTHEIFPHLFSKKDLTSSKKYEAVKRADHVICVSENTKYDLMRIFNVDSDKITVVHHGFNAPCCVNQSEKFDLARPYLLYVGNRSGYKNFTNLLNAYAQSELLLNHYMIVCFGGGVFSQDEQIQIKNLGLNSHNIFYAEGSDQSLSLLYNNAAVFVYPSLYEGFGIPLLEAMSHRCPVACSFTSSLPEVGGEGVAYFDPNSIYSITKTIITILEDSLYREKLINDGLIRTNQFSWDKTAKETMKVYGKII